MTESDNYEKLLQTELDKLLQQESLLHQIQSSIDSASESLDTLDQEMNHFESSSVAMETTEVSSAAAKLQNKLKVTLINQLSELTVYNYIVYSQYKT